MQGFVQSNDIKCIKHDYTFQVHFQTFFFFLILKNEKHKLSQDTNTWTIHHT